jgi:perosamine synthetase
VNSPRKAFAEGIPVSSADIGPKELEYAIEAVSSTWVASTGQFVDRFEHEWGERVGARCVSVSNGTTALHLAMLSLDVGPDQEVIVPALTYVAVANAVNYVGAEPVFVDVDLNTWCIDCDQVKAAITHKTTGIIAVHSYGHPADMDCIMALAEEHGLWVVEDAAEAHFARYRGKMVGGIGHVSTFSFYANKILTCGEGGALLTNDVELERKARLIRGQGMDPKRRYYFPVVGHNFRLSNVACSLLCAQLERVSEIVLARERIYAQYSAALEGIAGIHNQPVADWACPARWLYSIAIAEREYGMSRDELGARLLSEGVDSRPFFYPLNRLPSYARSAARRGIPTPHSDYLSECGLNLPTFNTLRPEQISAIGVMIRQIGSG